MIFNIVFEMFKTENDWKNSFETAPKTINFVSNRKPGKIVACFKIKTNFSFLNENP